MEAEEEGYREIPQSDAEDMHSEGKKENFDKKKYSALNLQLLKINIIP